jgi:hypothetical protein
VPDFEFTPGTDEPLGRIDTPHFDPDDFADEPRRSPREGLPPKFRMRHAPHYVEQLMGDAPLQTVRQIAVDQIDDLDGPSPASTFDELTASIREAGVLQPLLVAARDGSRFELVAGSNRLFAAREAGLATVPCLLVHADVESAAKLRAQARHHAVADVPPAPEPAPVDHVTPALARTALAEISTSMRFVNSLAPVARASESAARVSMILNAISIEANRAKVMAAAASLLSRPEPVRWAAFDCAALVDVIRGQVALEARVKGVRLEWTESFGLDATVADLDALTTAWSGLLHTVLDVAREGDRLEIVLSTPRVRPAIIFEVTLHTRSAAAYADRFLETEWRDHPAGQAGAVMLASAQLSAQLHGGRLSVRAVDDGMAVSFVAPQPLDLA